MNLLRCSLTSSLQPIQSARKHDVDSTSSKGGGGAVISQSTLLPSDSDDATSFGRRTQYRRLIYTVYRLSVVAERKSGLCGSELGRSVGSNYPHCFYCFYRARLGRLRRVAARVHLRLRSRSNARPRPFTTWSSRPLHALGLWISHRKRLKSYF